MNKYTAGLLWFFLAIAMVLGLLWQYYPLPGAADRMSRLPLQNGPVRQENIPLLPAEVAAFAGCSTLKRLAVFGDDMVILVVLDGTQNRHAVHDPTFCFRGAGWNIDQQDPFPLNHGAGSLVKLSKGASNAEALYWFSNGRTQYSSPLRYWGETSLRRVSLGHSGSEPLLVILTSATDKSPDWRALLEAWSELQEL